MAKRKAGRDRSLADDAGIVSEGAVARQTPEDAEQADLSREEMRRFREQYTEGLADGRENRERAEKDDRFLLGMDQWEADQVQRRKGRPTLTINKLPRVYHQIKNDITLNAPGIQLLPDDEAADADAASMLESHLRYIEHRSNGIEHRLNAVGQAISGGYGYYRVNKVWASDRGFDQELRILPVPNRSAVVDDEQCSEPDWRDRRYLILVDSLRKDDAVDLYPRNEWGSVADLGSELMPLWQGESRPVIEWWTRSVAGFETVQSNEKDAEGQPVRTRKVPVYEVTCRLTNGREVLLNPDGERLEWTWEGQWIPFMRVDGVRVNLKGKLHTEGAIHQARDSQRSLNYATSSLTEHFGVSARSPWMGPAEVFEGYQKYWEGANTEPWPYLPYNLAVLPGGVVAKPERVDPPPAPQTLGALIQDANQDLRDVTGMFQASTGQSANDESGYAREQVRGENDVNHYHYMKHLGIAMKFEAECLIDLIAAVYDTKRPLRTRDSEGQVREVRVNDMRQPTREKPRASWADLDAAGNPRKHYDLSVGRYSVVVQLGPSFATAREQARAGMDGLLQHVPPQFAAILAPFYAKAARWEDHQKIAQAFTMLLPPEVQAVLRDEPSGDTEATARQLKQEVAQLGAAMQQAQQIIQQLQTALEDKQREQQVDLLQAVLKTVSERLQTIASITTAKMRAEAQVLAAGMHREREGLGVSGALTFGEQGRRAMGEAASVSDSAVRTANQGLGDIASPPGGNPDGSAPGEGGNE